MADGEAFHGGRWLQEYVPVRHSLHLTRPWTRSPRVEYIVWPPAIRRNPSSLITTVVTRAGVGDDKGIETVV